MIYYFSPMTSTSIGILSWKAHDTLSRTLDSYARADLKSLFDEAVIHFNARSAEDDALAAHYGWTPAGDERNLGLLGGTEALAREMRGEFVLMLQNDCPLCVPADEAAASLAAARDLLASGRADIVRCRHRWNPGQGFSDVSNYLKYYRPGGRKTLRGLLRPFKAKRMIGRSLYFEKRPDLIFPRHVTKVGDFFIADSSVINFTDQPFFIRRDFLLRLVDWAKAHPKKRTLNGFQVLELNLNCAWWRRRHYRIGVGEGVFTHARFDDSFRPSHAAFNAGISRC